MKRFDTAVLKSVPSPTRTFNGFAMHALFPIVALAFLSLNGCGSDSAKAASPAAPSLAPTPRAQDADSALFGTWVGPGMGPDGTPWSQRAVFSAGNLHYERTCTYDDGETLTARADAETTDAPETGSAVLRGSTTALAQRGDRICQIDLYSQTRFFSKETSENGGIVLRLGFQLPQDPNERTTLLRKITE